MQLQFLKADRGDSILIEFEDDNRVLRRILIDGGTKSTYRRKNAKGIFESGHLHVIVEKIRSAGGKIDLLIVTHIDDDHIGGIINWLESDSSALDLIGEVWFNSGIYIANLIGLSSQILTEIHVQPVQNTNTSVDQAVSLTNYLTDQNKWNGQIHAAPSILEFHNMKFTFLSPSGEGLKKLYSKWENEAPGSLNTSAKLDYDVSLKDLLAHDEYESDQSIPNESSLAFIVEHGHKRILLLGDAHAEVVIENIHKLGRTESNPIEFDLIKLAHHGSARNTNTDLLKLIRSKRYVISGNGAIHGLPNKRCLARIIESTPDVTLYFNYTELIGRIFSEEDYKDFPQFTTGSAEATFII